MFAHVLQERRCICISYTKKTQCSLAKKKKGRHNAFLKKGRRHNAYLSTKKKKKKTKKLKNGKTKNLLHGMIVFCTNQFQSVLFSMTKFFFATMQSTF